MSKAPLLDGQGVCKEGSEPERNGGTRGESGQMPGGQWDQRR